MGAIGCGYVCRSGILPDIMVPPETGEARPTCSIGIRIVAKGKRSLVTRDETSSATEKRITKELPNKDMTGVIS